MPYYTFRCFQKGCNWRGEMNRKMGYTEGIVCPKCGKGIVRVVISAVPRKWGKGGAP